jgi:hypothetical protein
MSEKRKTPEKKETLRQKTLNCLSSEKWKNLDEIFTEVQRNLLTLNRETSRGQIKKTVTWLVANRFANFKYNFKTKCFEFIKIVQEIPTEQTPHYSNQELKTL